MTKETFWKFCLFLFFVASCASNNPNANSVKKDSQAPSSAPAPQVAQSSLAQKDDSSWHIASSPSLSPVWTRKMHGVISDLSEAKQGRAILVATSPDPDIEGSSNHYLLSRLDPSGRLVWEMKVKYPTKEQDISSDGAFAVVANYENQITGFDARGKSLWSIEGSCRPIIVNRTKKILCYNDDDADPHVAFDILDWSGKKIYSYPITHDILALKVSSDEKLVGMALSGGRVSLLGEDYKPLWERQLEGEVVDLSVSPLTEKSGVKSLKVAVLLRGSDKKQKVVVLDQAGNILGSGAPTFRAVQVELSPSGEQIYYYGNGSEGQYVGSFTIPFFVESWKKGGVMPSDYSSSIFVSPSMVLMGFEDVTLQDRTSHLLAFNDSGLLLWNLMLPADEGAYLYAHRYALASSLLVVATDDAKLNAFRIPQRK